MVPKIFGREPAIWLALIAALVYALNAFVFDWSDGQAALINGAAAAVLGVVTAWMLHDGWSAAALGAVKALLALALGFGLHWSPDQQAAVLTVASALVAAFVRTQASAPVPSSAAP